MPKSGTSEKLRNYMTPDTKTEESQYYRYIGDCDMTPKEDKEFKSAKQILTQNKRKSYNDRRNTMTPYSDDECGSFISTRDKDMTPLYDYEEDGETPVDDVDYIPRDMHMTQVLYQSESENDEIEEIQVLYQSGSESDESIVEKIPAEGEQVFRYPG